MCISVSYRCIHLSLPFAMLDNSINHLFGHFLTTHKTQSNTTDEIEDNEFSRSLEKHRSMLSYDTFMSEISAC